MSQGGRLSAAMVLHNDVMAWKLTLSALLGLCQGDNLWEPTFCSCRWQMASNEAFDVFVHVRLNTLLKKLIGFEDGQDTSACKISGHFLYAFFGKCPETAPDGRTDGRTCRKTVTFGQVDQWTHVQVKRGYFRLRTEGRTTRKHDASGA